MLNALRSVVDPASITAIVNTGDDVILHGLHISPDLDTITYTLAGEIDPERGWGLRAESWQAMATLGRLGGIDWFNLGDRDLGTHLFRTQRLGEGATLSEVTREIATGYGVDVDIRPVTDDPVRTRVTLASGDEIGFQEYFVRLAHDVTVAEVHFAGAAEATPSPGVLEVIATADVVVLAPSNPVVSLAPVLAVAGVTEALAARRDAVVGVSPIIGGRALKGPADRLLKELGHEATAVGVARFHREVAGSMVIDTVDAELASRIEELGVRAVVTQTVMSTPERAADLAQTVLGAAR
jgi:LPPG:FO 2-phospho-L-lactate transferase